MAGKANPTGWIRVPNGGTPELPSVYTAIREALQESADSIRTLQSQVDSIKPSAATSTTTTIISGDGGGGGGGGGSVTSVGLDLSAEAAAVFGVTGSPVLTAGTITLGLDTQTANKVFAGPTTGVADEPTFRSLVAGDIPDISATYLTVATAASTYLTQASAASTYLTQANAALTYLALSGGTLTGRLNLPASTATANGANLNLGSGATPSSFSDGDVWVTAIGINARVAGSSLTLFPYEGGQFTGTVTTKAGTMSAAGLILASGTNLTTPAAGAVEFDGTNLYFTPSSTRKTVAFTDSNITGTAANVTGVVAVANGGTGQSSYADGELLIGKTAGGTLNKTTLTPGPGVTITNGAGTITISATGSGGTVTSVGVDLSTEAAAVLSVANSPVTSSGTITLGLDTQTANTVFAGPTTGVADEPTFRSLVAADIPSLSSIYLPLAGGTMGGPINMGTYDINNGGIFTLKGQRSYVSSGGGSGTNGHYAPVARLTITGQFQAAALTLEVTEGATSGDATAVATGIVRVRLKQQNAMAAAPYIDVDVAAGASDDWDTDSFIFITTTNDASKTEGTLYIEQPYQFTNMTATVLDYSLSVGASYILCTASTTPTNALVAPGLLPGGPQTKPVAMMLGGASILRFLTGSTERMRIASNGNVTVDTSTFAVDAVNNRVGVRTTSPASPLHVYEDTTSVDSTAGLTIEQDGTGDAVVQFLLTGVRRWVAGADNSDGDKFKIASTVDLDSDARLTITTDGAVGIGITDPGAKLEFVNTNAAFNTTIPGTTRYATHFRSGTTNDQATGITWAGNNGTTTAAHAGIYVQSSGSYGTKMYFATTNSYATGAQTAMTIDHNRFVGIGVVPSYRFHVSESYTGAGQNVTTRLNSSVSPAAANANVQYGVFNTLIVNPNATGAARALYSAVQHRGASDTGVLSGGWFGIDNDDAATMGSTISDAVAIYAMTPSQNAMGGMITNSYGLYVQAQSGTNITKSFGVYQAGTSDTNYFAGKVGIGEDSPTSRLHLPAGTTAASTAPLKFTSGTNLTTPEAGAMEFDGTLYFTPSTTRRAVAFTDSDITGTSANVTGTVAIAKGGTGLTSAGSVNQVLGVVSAGSTLEYKTVTAGTGISITHAAGNITITNTSPSSGGTVTSVTGTSPISVVNGTTTPAISLGTVLTTNGGTGLTTYTAGDLLYYATGTALSKLSVTAGGMLYGGASAPAYTATADLRWDNTNKRLGIGVASPIYKLDVQNNVNSENVIRVRNPNTGALAKAYLVADSSGGLAEFISLSSGFTAAGLYAPNSQVVSGSGSAGLAVAAINAAGPLMFYTGGVASGNERMRITSGGNVGIGITSPTAKLHTVATVTSVSSSLFDQGVYTVTPSGAASGTYTGRYSEITATGATLTGTVYGSNTLARSNATSNVSTVIAVAAQVSLLNTGNITSAAALYAEAPVKTGAGAITNNYGVYISSQAAAAATNNFGLYGAGTSDNNVLAGNLRVGSALVASSRLHVIENTTNVGATAGVTIEQSGAGDSVLQFLLTSAQRWVAGIDNSDSDKFKIASSVDLATDARLTITTAGNVGVGTDAPGGRFDAYFSGTRPTFGAGASDKFIFQSGNNNFGQIQIANATSDGETSIGFVSGATALGNTPISANGDTRIWAIGPGVFSIGGAAFGISNKSFNAAMLQCTSAGNVIVGKGTQTLNRTDEYLYITTINSAIAPATAPTAVTNRVPIMYNVSDNKLYVYNGGWKAVTLA